MNALVVAQVVLVGLLLVPFVVALRTRGGVPAVHTRLVQEDLYRQAERDARLRRSDVRTCTGCRHCRARRAA
jgi:hypothetical protein